MASAEGAKLLVIKGLGSVVSCPATDAF